MYGNCVRISSIPSSRRVTADDDNTEPWNVSINQTNINQTG